MGATLQIGVDIGGTFTDVVLLDGRSGLRCKAKVLTTPADPSAGVIKGVESVLQIAGVQMPAVTSIVHGTTLATNAIIERKGARTALLTTQGFRDILETGTELRYDLYDVGIVFPKPLIPRERRVGVGERTKYDGQILTSLSQDDLAASVERLIEDDVEAIAICFLHSYANPTNEQQAGALIRRRWPSVAVSLSSEVLRELGELGRTSTTAANAYVQPLVRSYLDSLEQGLRQARFEGSFLVMSSSGGSISAELAKAFPVRLVESGPAAGASAATYLTRVIDTPNVLAFDMGGTTAKMCLISNGIASQTTEFEVARIKRFAKGSGLLLKIPAVDLIEIGAGGGSVTYIDSAGLLAVGPESVGAQPGPACYGQGGAEATVTDADLVLGYLNPSFFLGGTMTLDFQAAKTAVAEHVGATLGVSTEVAAHSVHEVVNENMANSASVYAAEKGVDLREYTLVAFGGAAPAHACDVARRLGIEKVVVPASAGVLSALGCLLSPLSMDFVMGYLSALDNADWDRVGAYYEEAERQGQTLLERAGVSTPILGRSADMRYLGQRYEVRIPLPADRPLSAADVPAIEATFVRMYREQYGRDIAEVPIEVVQWRLNVSGPTPSVDLREVASNEADRPAKPVGYRDAFFGVPSGFMRSAVYRRAELTPGCEFVGPCVVEDIESTTVAPPDSSVLVDTFGNLMISLHLSEA